MFNVFQRSQETRKIKFYFKTSRRAPTHYPLLNSGFFRLVASFAEHRQSEQLINKITIILDAFSSIGTKSINFFASFFLFIRGLRPLCIIFKWLGQRSELYNKMAPRIALVNFDQSKYPKVQGLLPAPLPASGRGSPSFRGAATHEAPTFGHHELNANKICDRPIPPP